MEVAKGNEPKDGAVNGFLKQLHEENEALQRDLQRFIATNILPEKKKQVKTESSGNDSDDSMDYRKPLRHKSFTVKTDDHRKRSFSAGNENKLEGMQPLERRKSLGTVEEVLRSTSATTADSDNYGFILMTPEEDDVDEVVITPGIKELVTHLCEYSSTFQDFPLETLNEEDAVTTKKKERHQKLILQEVPRLAQLKEKLCPSILPENVFWRIYFALIKKKIGNSLNVQKHTHEFRNEKEYKLTRKPVLVPLATRSEITEGFWAHFFQHEWQEESCDETFEPQQIKEYCRMGVPDSYRKDVWLYVSGGKDILSAEGQNFFSKKKEQLYSDNEQAFVSTREYLKRYLPSRFTFEAHPLSLSGIEAAKDVFAVLVADNENILFTYPFLADLVCCCLLFQSRDETLATCLGFLRKPKVELFSVFEASLFSPSLFPLIAHHVAILDEKVHEVGLEPSFAEEWIFRTFTTSLPYQSALHVVDCLLSEGLKVLFRVVLGVLKMCGAALHDATSPIDFIAIVNNQLQSIHDSAFLIEFAVSTKVKHKELLAALKEVSRASLPQIPNECCEILTVDQFYDMWAFLPPRYKMYPPKLLYRTSIDGFNLHRLIQKCQGIEPIVLVFKSRCQSIFGAFVTVSLEVTNNYIGTGDMFLFSIYPTLKKYPASKDDQLYMMLESKRLLFGGGAISIDEELHYGWSKYTKTFKNMRFTQNEDFECVAVEVFTASP